MPIRRSTTIAPLLLAWVALPALIPSLAAAQRPCTGPEHAALDYLLGDWRLVDAQGTAVGRSTFRSTAGGCALIEEHRDDAGRESHGLLYRDPASGEWHGAWVDPDGQVFRVAGEAGDGRAVLEGDSVSPQGSWRARMTFEQERDGGRASDRGVALKLERSTDGGESWGVVAEGRYVPAAAAPSRPTAPREPTPEVRERATPMPTPRDEPSSPAEPTETVRAEPAPKPDPPRPPIEQSAREDDRADRRPAAPGGVVEVLSAQATGPSSDPIRMASPMRLQLPLGPVENLPEGYGWSSTDTAVYVTDGISIPRVTVERGRRGGRYEIEATVQLHAGAMFARADLGVELLGPDGEVVGSEEIPNVSVGRGIPEQSAEGAVSVAFRLRLDRETLDALFAASERPSLRLTVAVRKSG